MVKHHIRGSCLQDNLDRIKDFHHEGYAEAIRGDRGSILRGEHLSVQNAMPTGNKASCSCLCCLDQAVRKPRLLSQDPLVLGPWLGASCSLGYAGKSFLLQFTIVSLSESTQCLVTMCDPRRHTPMNTPAQDPDTTALWTWKAHKGSSWSSWRIHTLRHANHSSGRILFQSFWRRRGQYLIVLTMHQVEF